MGDKQKSFSFETSQNFANHLLASFPKLHRKRERGEGGEGGTEGRRGGREGRKEGEEVIFFLRICGGAWFSVLPESHMYICT